MGENQLFPASWTLFLMKQQSNKYELLIFYYTKQINEFGTMKTTAEKMKSNKGHVYVFKKN